MKRLLITGDRKWEDRTLIHKMLERFKNEGYNTLIEGEARGADLIAREEAEKIGYSILESAPGVKGFPAKWEEYRLKYPVQKYGMKWKTAGTDRNTQMLVEGKPDWFVAFHSNIDESKGTKNMIGQCVKAGIKGILVVDKFTVINYF